MAEQFVLTDKTRRALAELVAGMGQAQQRTNPPPTPQRLIAVVTAGALEGTLPDTTTPYHAVTAVEALDSAGEWVSLTAADCWLVGAGKVELTEDASYMCVAGPAWDDGSGARAVFVAAGGITAAEMAAIAALIERTFVVYSALPLASSSPDVSAQAVGDGAIIGVAGAGHTGVTGLYPFIDKVHITVMGWTESPPGVYTPTPIWTRLLDTVDYNYFVSQLTIKLDTSTFTTYTTGLSAFFTSPGVPFINAGGGERVSISIGSR